MKRFIFVILLLIGLMMPDQAWAKPKQKLPPLETYNDLQQLLRPLIATHQWANALRLAQQYQSVFSQDSDYHDLCRLLAQPQDTTIHVEPLPYTVNTYAHEYGPVVSADGKTLYFCGFQRQDNFEREDIFVSHWDEKTNQFGRARLITSLASRYHDAPLSISMDGTQMLFYRNGKLHLTMRNADGQWQQPVLLPQEVLIGQWQADAMFTADGKALLFASDKGTNREALPSLNIYIAFLQDDGTFSTPMDLGPVINSDKKDRAPVLHPDMHTLYFASEAHGSLGGLDIYKSTRLGDDCWDCWSKPVNLGKEVNTVGDDCWFGLTADGDWAYLAQQSEVSGFDICRVKMSDAMRPEPVVTLSGLVTDENGQKVHTEILWEDLTTGKTLGYISTDPETGAYFMALPMTHKYGYYIQDTLYMPYSENIVLAQEDHGVHLTRDIHLTSIRSMAAGETAICLKNIFFETAKSELLPESFAELNRLVDFMLSRKVKIEVAGHTDNVGSDEDNQRLSLNRANAVRTYLVEHGVEPERIAAQGYGESRPVADNQTEEGRAQNRRVEMRIK